MSDSDVELRLRTALNELAEATSLLNPDPPVLGGSPDGVHSDRPAAELATRSIPSMPSGSAQPTGRAAWFDIKILVLAASIVIIALAIFSVSQIRHGRTSPTTHTTVPAPLGFVTVPDFVGQGPLSVNAEAHNHGLTIHVHYVRSRKPTASVISQAPPSGSQVPVGGVVTLVISNGNAPPPVPGATETVPNVVGLAFDKALAVLQTAGLTNSLANLCPATATYVRVVAQSPPAGSIVPQDSRVSITSTCS